MGFLLSALCLLAAAQEANQQKPDPKTLYRQASDCWLEGDHAKQRKLLEQLIREFPDNDTWTPMALEEIGKLCDANTPQGREDAIKCYQTLMTRPHKASETSILRPLVEKIRGWTFAKVPSYIIPEENAMVDVTRPAGPPSRFRLFRLPPEEVRRAPEGITPRLVSPEKWVLQKEWDIPHEGHKRAIWLDLSTPGYYVLEEDIEGFLNRTLLHIQTFRVLLAEGANEDFLQVVDPASGDPLEGVSITAATKNGIVRGLTGKDGMFTIPAPLEGMFAVARGDEVHAVRIGEEAAWAHSPCPQIYITTDRSVYRPGQTVHYKAVCRHRKDVVFAMPSGGKARIRIRAPGDHIVRSEEREWNAMGSLSGSFTLGEEPPLGEYEVLVTTGENLRGEVGPYRIFRVAEYRKPEICVGVELAPPSPDGKFRARIRATYFFGGPCANAEVQWEAVGRTTLHTSLDEQVRTLQRDPRAWFFRSRHGWDWDENPIASGKGRTNAEGILEVDLDIPSDKQPESCALTASVRDISGFTATGEVVLPLNSASILAAVATNRRFYAPGEIMNIHAWAVLPDGRPAPGRKIEVAVFERFVPKKDVVEYEAVQTASGTSGEDGLASFKIPAPSPGQVRIRARVIDEGGGKAEDRCDLWVAAPGAAAKDLLDVGLLTDRAIYEEGETIRLMVLSRMVPRTIFVTVDGELAHEAWTFRLSKPCEIVEIPVRAKWAPDAGITVRSFQEMSLDEQHVECILIYPRRNFLDMEVRTDKPVYGPRERMRVSVTTMAEGAPLPAEVELSIVDASIFSMEPDRTIDIRRYFFPLNRAWIIGSCATLCAEPENVPARRLFPDTLHWNAHAQTGKDGKLELDIETPDSLTTWRVLARAISGVDRFGEGVSEVVTRKDVILRLAVPRFLTERDECVVSGILHNDLPREEEFEVRLETEGLEGKLDAKKVKVPSKGVAQVDWAVRAVRAGTAVLRGQARSAGGSDAIELKIPVQRHGLPGQAMAMGMVEDRWEGILRLPDTAAVETAELDVVFTPAGVPAIREALPFLAGYPYGCVEQTMSRFLPSLAAAAAMRRLEIPEPALEKSLPDMVDKGLQRLYKFQHSGDNGWGWWEHDKTNARMTAYVMFGLLYARQAGFAVDPQTLGSGLEALRQMDPSPFALYVRSLAGEDVGALPAEQDPKTDEDRAFLVLAGRKELAEEWKWAPGNETRPEDVRSASLWIRALASVDPDDARIQPLVGWLMSCRRGSAWYSTLDSAYAVMALAQVARKDEDPRGRILLNGQEVASEPGRITIPGSRLKAGVNKVEVERTGGGAGFASAVLRYWEQGETPPPAAFPIETERKLLRAVGNEDNRAWEEMESGSEVVVGEEIRVVLNARSDTGLDSVMLECPIAAGTEGLEERTDLWWGNAQPLARMEFRDEKVALALNGVTADADAVGFILRAVRPGTYHILPARAFAMYDPDRGGSSTEFVLRVR